MMVRDSFTARNPHFYTVRVQALVTYLAYLDRCQMPQPTKGNLRSGSSRDPGGKSVRKSLWAISTTYELLTIQSSF